MWLANPIMKAIGCAYYSGFDDFIVSEKNLDYSDQLDYDPDKFFR